MSHSLAIIRRDPSGRIAAVVGGKIAHSRRSGAGEEQADKMFAKLRPGHRRSGSTPTSPSPNQVPSGFLPIPPSSSHGPTSPSSIEEFLHGFKSSASSHGPSTSDKPISPIPPSLPQIPRIASVSGGGEGQEGVRERLQRAKTTESLESQSSGSPIISDQYVFSPGRHEQYQGQDRLRDMRSPSGQSDQSGHYRSPSGQLMSPPVRREAGVSESEFRSILQGKHLPALPTDNANAPRRPSDMVSPPPLSSHDELHQLYPRPHEPYPRPQEAYSIQQETHSKPQVMSLGNQSKQSVPSTTTKFSDRTTRTKTRLLNPMSLLMRRRNGQTLDHLAEESLISSRNSSMGSPGLPDDYDPSIRGKVVHDFSAPRPRRNFSDQNMVDLAEKERKESSSRESQYVKGRSFSEDQRHDRQHTPVFKENFEDDGDTARVDSALRAESLANTDFVARNSLLPLAHEETVPGPPFARNGQKTVHKLPQEAPAIPSPPPPPVPTKDEEEATIARMAMPLSPLIEDPLYSPDMDTTPRRDSRTSTLRQSVATSHRSPASARSSRISRMNSAASQNSLPSHMFSRASRFSFQYASNDSAAQERILEERHKEKAAKAKANRSSDTYEDEDEFNYDDMDMDAMDDDVPMNGEAWDYGGGGLGIGNMTLNDMQNGGGSGLGGMSLDGFEGNDFADDDFGGGGLGDMSFDDFGTGGLGNMSLDDMPASKGNVIGNMTLDDMSPLSPIDAKSAFDSLTASPANATAGAPMHGLGLGIETADYAAVPMVRSESISSIPPSNKSSMSIKRRPVSVRKASELDPTQQDDFYFADGDFADEDFLREINGTGLNEGEEAFDENVFDDPNHPLYERKSLASSGAPPLPRMSSKRTHNTLRNRRPKSRPTSDPLPEHPDPAAPIEHVDAYHSALAAFAHKAAASGRFDRASSIDSSAGAYHGGPVQTGGSEMSPNMPTQPELTPDVARLSQESSTVSPATARASGGHELDDMMAHKSVDFMLSGNDEEGIYGHSYASDFDYSDYESTYEDDPMIAAANADALENDDEGDYGSEFGFYARPGSQENDTGGEMYGGYFGPKNWGEIKRQRSTREPNLTPITERSEYSTRNSFIGVDFAGGESSPALAQLARMSPAFDGDMTLEQLLKLRKKQWGGSDKSSSRGSPMNSSSPIVSMPQSSDGPRSQSGLQPQWSSPMSRNVFSPGEIPEDREEADDEYDDGMANYDDIEEADEEYEEYQENDEGDETGVSPLDESPSSESPTIRAIAAPQDHSASVSPMKLGPPFSFPTTNESPTIPQNALSPLVTHSQRSSAVLVSPISPSIGGPSHKPGHSRTGSDSVSYSRERDEEKGEFRWVLERRRTAEDGGEVVERTTVEGGRI